MWVHDLKKSSWLKDVGGFDFPLFNLNIILYILKFSICLAMFNAIEPKICAAKTLWVALHLLVAMGSSHDLQRARQEAPTKPPSCGATFPRRCAFFGAPFLYVLMRRRILVHLYCRHEWWRNFHWSHACLLFTFRRQVRSSFLKTKRGECVIVSVCVECGDLGNFRKFSVLTVKKKLVVLLDCCLRREKFFCLYPPRSPTIWVFPKMVVPPKHPKLVIFSRKTNSSWVPPF